MKTEIIKTTCDRCGKEISDWHDVAFRFYKRKFWISRGAFREDKEMDLCKDCYESFRKWLYEPELKGESK